MSELDAYRSGSTEPWTADLIHALVRALRPKRVLELGTYLGLTTRRLLDALEPSAVLVTVESDEDRWRTAAAALPAVTCVHTDAIAFLQAATEPFDFVFVDDDHTVMHVARELELLLDANRPLVTPGGLVVVHDVCGPFNLAGLVTRYHGFVLDLPKLHIAGGLGLIQRRAS